MAFVLFICHIYISHVACSNLYLHQLLDFGIGQGFVFSIFSHLVRVIYFIDLLNCSEILTKLYTYFIEQGGHLIGKLRLDI